MDGHEVPGIDKQWPLDWLSTWLTPFQRGFIPSYFHHSLRVSSCRARILQNFFGKSTTFQILLVEVQKPGVFLLGGFRIFRICRILMYLFFLVQIEFWVKKLKLPELWRRSFFNKWTNHKVVHATEKWWLEDDPFLLGRPIFRAYVKFWVCKINNF